MDHSFAPRRNITEKKALQSSFHRAVVEVYTLKQAGMDMDLAAYEHRGAYGATDRSFSTVELFQASNGELFLKYPFKGAKAKLLEKIRTTRAPTNSGEEELTDDMEAAMSETQGELFDEADGTKDANVPVVTPVKAGPLVKQDAKPFDFMSNRPVPRTKTETTIVKEKTPPAVPEATPMLVETAPPAKPAQPAVDVEAAFAKSQAELAEIRHAVLEAAAKKSEQTIAEMLNSVRGNIEVMASDSITVIDPAKTARVKKPHFTLRKIKIDDPAVLFAVSPPSTPLTPFQTLRLIPSSSPNASTH